MCDDFGWLLNGSLDNNSRVMIFSNWFLWWASVASHQVDWWYNNDRTVREKQNSKLLVEKWIKDYEWVKDEKLQKDIWNEYYYISWKCADYKNRYIEDFEIMKNLNFNAFRFSLEWSLIQPEKWKYSKEWISH